MSIRQIANDVWKKLGPGYSESVYHAAFEVGLRTFGLYYETERIVPVYYLDQNVGHVRADLIVDRKIVIELKAVSKINESYRIQTKNYMDLLCLDHGYLINFPDRVIEFPEVEEFHRPKPPLERIDC